MESILISWESAATHSTTTPILKLDGVKGVHTRKVFQVAECVIIHCGRV
jgi:hypothetical protein